MAWKILVADDSADDQFLITHAMKKAGAACSMYTVDDGAEAISYLCGSGEYADRARFPFPDLLLLDLKMPRLGGFDVLRWLRTSPYKDLPVVAHSTSRLESDVQQAFELGASDYLLKSPDLAQVAAALVSFIQGLSRSHDSSGENRPAGLSLRPAFMRVNWPNTHATCASKLQDRNAQAG